MSQQSRPSSPEYASPPNNQLQCDSADDQQITQRPPVSFQGKQIEEILSGFTPFNMTEDLDKPFLAESQRDRQFIHEQSLEFLDLALDAWARNLARIPSMTQAESTRLGELLSGVLDRERQQGMSAPLILSDSDRPRRTVFQSCADFFAASCKSLEGFLHQLRSLIASLRGV